jgi:hypothetical protein
MGLFVLSQAALIFAVLISLLHYSVAQENPPSGSISAAQSSDRSPYLGRPIMHPEELSGLWEAHDGHGGAVGIHLLLTTPSPVAQIPSAVRSNRGRRLKLACTSERGS